MTFYLNILNPIDKFDKGTSTTIVDNDLVGFDGLFMTLVAGDVTNSAANDGTTDAKAFLSKIEAPSTTAANVMVDTFCDSTLTEG